MGERLNESWKLTHPKMALIVACILSIGHFLSPDPLNLERYGLGVLGVIVALVGVYRFNEVSDFKRGSTPWRYHVTIGCILIVLGVTMGVYLSIKYAWWVVVLLAIGAGGMVAYNVLRSPIIHNRVFYAFIWGGFPFYGSYALQTLNPVPTPGIVAWAVFFSVVAVEVLWTWGPVGCRHQAECKRATPDKVCHSPVMTCKDRMDIPASVRKHTQLMVTMKAVVIVLLMIAVLLMRKGLLEGRP